MSTFFPIYNRSSDALNQRRLTATLQANQSKLDQIQQQVASGRRIHSPSEDPIAALRAVRYQAALERNTQYARNLQSNRSFLDATDTQIRNASDLLTQLKGNLTSWADSGLTDTQRKAAVSQLTGMREQLLGIANTTYNGRYLFAGSNPQQIPYTTVDGKVQFNGNLGAIQSPANDQGLMQNNLSGDGVFGGLSSSTKTSSTLQPALSSNTRLSDLRGGSGIQAGTIEISDGFQSSLVDLSTAETVGDIVRLLEANPPGGRHLSVEIKQDHLELRFADNGSTALSIRDTNGGTTAADLGIRSGLAATTGDRLVGQGLSPVIALNTPLAELTGSPSVAYLTSPGQANDIVFRAHSNGSSNNGVTIQYVNSQNLQAGDGIRQGSEEVYFETTPRAAYAGLSLSGTGNDLSLTATTPGAAANQISFQLVDAGAIGNTATANYDSSTKTYTIGIDSGNATTVQAVMDAINAEGTFSAAPDVSDPANGAFNPAAIVDTADIGVATTSTGNSGGDANTVFIHVNPEKTQVKHVLAALNKNSDLTERFDIQLDVSDGLNVTEPGKTIIDAQQRTVTGGGAGEDFDGPPGIEMVVDGKKYRLPLQNVVTVQDFINEIESQVPGAYAQINAQGNGFSVGVKRSGVTFAIGENGGETATQLGLRTFTGDTLLSSLNGGLGVATQNGIDFTIHRNDGTSIGIDISTARTVQDVMDLINDHPDNQDPETLVKVYLSQYGNAITINDDNPTGNMPVSIEVANGSSAAVDLGLLLPGMTIGYPGNVSPPTKANVEILYSGPAGVERSFSVTANEPGNEYNNVEIEIVAGAIGGQANATFDTVNNKLVVQVDPSATRTSTVIDAINQTGYFRAELINNDYEAYNAGTGLVSELGVIGTLGGGSASPSAKPARAILRPPVPDDLNTAIDVVSNQPGTKHNFTRIELVGGASGNSATAAYDSVNKKLILTINPGVTTANTIVNAINAEGTFSGSLNLDVDATNDGSGTYPATGLLGTANQGTPGVYKGQDVSVQENHSIFNTIDRLIDALSDGSEFGRVEMERISGLLDEDLDRLDTAIANIGYRGQRNDLLVFQNEDLNLELQESLSDEIDVDLVDAISRLTTQQAAVEASMRMLSQTYNISLLDYL